MLMRQSQTAEDVSFFNNQQFQVNSKPLKTQVKCYTCGVCCTHFAFICYLLLYENFRFSTPCYTP